MHAALRGLRVLEYGTGVGSGYCGSLFSQLGADVTKIRNQGIEPQNKEAAVRQRAEELYLDTGKNTTEGPLSLDALAKLSANVNVVVRGCDPYHGDDDRRTLEAEYRVCAAANAAIVFVVLTPFGITGPGAAWHGGDLNAQVLSGWPFLVGNPDESPLAMNYGVGPLQQAIAAAAGAMAAVLERRNSGGELVDVAEADVVASTMRLYSLVYLFLGIPLKRQGLRAPGSSGRYPHTLLPCKDGYISTICRSQVEWDRFMEMIGNPAWAEENRYKDFFKMGTEYPDEVDALIIPWLMEHTKDELAVLAAHYRVPLAPVRTVDEVLGDDQLQYRQFFRSAESDGHTVLIPGLPVNWQTRG